MQIHDGEGGFGAFHIREDGQSGPRHALPGAAPAPATPVTYELDGGARKAVTRIKTRVVPGVLTVCCPA